MSAGKRNVDWMIKVSVLVNLWLGHFHVCTLSPICTFTCIMWCRYCKRSNIYHSTLTALVNAIVPIHTYTERERVTCQTLIDIAKQRYSFNFRHDRPDFIIMVDAMIIINGTYKSTAWLYQSLLSRVKFQLSKASLSLSLHPSLFLIHFAER